MLALKTTTTHLSYLAVWSPHKDTLSDFLLVVTCVKASAEQHLNHYLVKKNNKEDILNECIPIKDWTGSCVDDTMSAEFNEGIYRCLRTCRLYLEVCYCQCHLYQSVANTTGVIQSMIHNQVLPVVIYQIQIVCGGVCVEKKHIEAIVVFFLVFLFEQ